MVLFAKSLRGSVLAATVAALALGGCEGGYDIEVNAPILNAVGLNLSSKPKAEADLPERPGLVMPPSTASLPQPGERTAAAAQNWPVDPDQERKKKADADTAAREKYCAEGDWSGKGGITEFEKNTGVTPRCPSKLGDAFTKSFGGGPATAR
jgi:hypothetical protein